MKNNTDNSPSLSKEDHTIKTPFRVRVGNLVALRPQTLLHRNLSVSKEGDSNDEDNIKNDDVSNSTVVDLFTQSQKLQKSNNIVEMWMNPEIGRDDGFALLGKYIRFQSSLLFLHLQQQTTTTTTTTAKSKSQKENNDNDLKARKLIEKKALEESNGIVCGEVIRILNPDCTIIEEKDTLIRGIQVEILIHRKELYPSFQDKYLKNSTHTKPKKKELQMRNYEMQIQGRGMCSFKIFLPNIWEFLIHTSSTSAKNSNSQVSKKRRMLYGWEVLKIICRINNKASNIQVEKNNGDNAVNVARKKRRKKRKHDEIIIDAYPNGDKYIIRQEDEPFFKTMESKTFNDDTERQERNYKWLIRHHLLHNPSKSQYYSDVLNEYPVIRRKKKKKKTTKNDDRSNLPPPPELNNFYNTTFGKVVAVEILSTPSATVTTKKNSSNNDIDKSSPSSLAIVTFKRIWIPEFTKQGRIFSNDKSKPYWVFEEEDQRDLVIKVPIETLVVVDKSVSPLFSYSFKQNTYIPINNSYDVRKEKEGTHDKEKKAYDYYKKLTNNQQKKKQHQEHLLIKESNNEVVCHPKNIDGEKRMIDSLCNRLEENYDRKEDGKREDRTIPFDLGEDFLIINQNQREPKTIEPTKAQPITHKISRNEENRQTPKNKKVKNKRNTPTMKEGKKTEDNPNHKQRLINQIDGKICSRSHSYDRNEKINNKSILSSSLDNHTSNAMNDFKRMNDGLRNLRSNINLMKTNNDSVTSTIAVAQNKEKIKSNGISTKNNGGNEVSNSMFNSSSSSRAERSMKRAIMKDVTMAITMTSNTNKTKNSNTRKKSDRMMIQDHLPSSIQLQRRQPKLTFCRSAIHHWGVFAEDFIQKGEFVIEYIGEIISNPVADIREKEYEKAQIGSDYMFRIDSQCVCDATKEGSLARFINASCDPNCVTKIIQVDGVKKICIYAKKNIGPGEELCYDYKFPIEPDMSKKLKCNCRKPNCRGYLN